MCVCGEVFSIKHDLARSCFKFWLKIGDKGDKIENMISSDYVLCYIPRALETLEKNENFVIG